MKYQKRIIPTMGPFVVTASPNVVSLYSEHNRLRGVYTMEDGSVIEEESVVLSGDSIAAGVAASSKEESILFVNSDGIASLIYMKDGSTAQLGKFVSSTDKPDSDHSYDPAAETYWFIE